jgi:hypothetical protein
MKCTEVWSCSAAAITSTCIQKCSPFFCASEKHGNHFWDIRFLRRPVKGLKTVSRFSPSEIWVFFLILFKVLSDIGRIYFGSSVVWHKNSACQRPILNFTPGPQGWTCPPGVKFVPWGWSSPLRPPRGEHSLLFRRMEGPTENFTPRG